MTDLAKLNDEPALLTNDGFARREEETTEPVRMVWYEKTYESDESQIRFIVQVEFELSISDSPYGSHRDNLNYCFNGVFLVVVDRQMEGLNNAAYDEDTETPREIDRWMLSIRTMDKLRTFSSALGVPRNE